MSWVTEDWTAELSGRALHKVRELEGQLEQLKREKQQRQLKLDSAETALSKEKLKFEEVRSELVAVQRELQSSRDEAQTGLRARERLSQELQVKQALVCSLEGQLDAARTLTNTLTQEIKRLETELEKLQNTNSSVDSALFSTPCWNTSSPRDQGFRWEERDRQKGNSDVKAQHVRQLQFSDHSPKLPVGRVQSPQQTNSSTPIHRTGRRLNSSTPSAVFPWEREDAFSIPKGSTLSFSQPRSEVTDRQPPGDCSLENDLRKENDDQRSVIQELRTQVLSLEQEAHLASDQRRSFEMKLVEVQDELLARERTLTRTRDELSRMSASLEKESNRAQSAEQRVKQLQEELSCQRQNAESSRRSMEQSRRNLEKEHHRELLELQRDSQAMERQQQQEISRLKQEIQQAQALHNTLQAQCDKVLLQKQAVEKELDTAKGKQQWAEKELQASRQAEAQTQAKLMETLREKDSLTVSREQSERRAKSLEEEVKRLMQELNEALKLLRELQDQHAAPAPPAAPPRFTLAGESFSTSVITYPERSNQPLLRKKKGTKQENLREAGLDEEMANTTARVQYPSDREPGEGIDANDMREFGSRTIEKPKGEGEKGLSQNEAEAEEDYKVRRKEYSVHDIGVSGNLQTEGRRPDIYQEEVEKQDLCSDEAHSQKTDDEGLGKHNRCSLQDLKKQNLALRDELKEAKRELELRLEDLETQRRAETEARTKLKQVCRKHSSQVEQLRQKTQGLKDENEKLGKQLVEEQGETARLAEALATLELRSREMEEQKETEKDMKKQNASLSAKVEALKSKLEKERDDREQEKEHRREEEQKRGEEQQREVEARRAFIERITELEAELRGKRDGSDDSREVGDATSDSCLPMDNSKENSNSKSNAPLTVHNILPSSHDFSSPYSEPLNIKHKTYCTSKQGPQLKTEDDPESFLNREEKQAELNEGLYSEEETVQLVLEVERLRTACEALQEERDRESSRAKQAQVKLEALQSQVTNQTKQLTLAFESQSSHIEDLLRELNERDRAICRLQGELQSYQGQIDALKAEKCNTTVRVDTEKMKSMANVTVTPGCQSELGVKGHKAIKNTLENPELLQPAVISVTQQGLCDSSADVQERVCDLTAENEELRGKLEACVSLRRSGEYDPGKSSLIEEIPSLAEELKVTQIEVIHLKAENEKIKCQLAEVTAANGHKQQPLDPEVKRRSENENGEVGGAAKRLLKELHSGQSTVDSVDFKGGDRLTPKHKEVTVVRQEMQRSSGGKKDSEIEVLMEELQLIKLENTELKLKLQVLPEKEERIPQGQTDRRAIDRSEEEFQSNQDKLIPLHKNTEELDSKMCLFSCPSQQTNVTSACESTKDGESQLPLQTYVKLRCENEVDISAGGSALYQSSVLINTDGSASEFQQCFNAINTLLAENKTLRSWALSVCPPERWGEIPAISEDVQNWISCLSSGTAIADAAERMNPTLIHLIAAEKVVMPEERKDIDLQKSLELSSAQNLVPETDGLSLVTAEAQVAGEGLQEKDQQPGQPGVSLSMSARELKGTQRVQDISTQTGLEEEKYENTIAQMRQQLQDLQSQLSSLAEVNERQAEELEVWKMTGGTITPMSFGEPTIHSGEHSIVVRCEDHMLVSCRLSGNCGDAGENANIKAVAHREVEMVTGAPKSMCLTCASGTCQAHVIGADQEDTRKQVQLRETEQVTIGPDDQKRGAKTTDSTGDRVMPTSYGDNHSKGIVKAEDQTKVNSDQGNAAFAVEDAEFTKSSNVSKQTKVAECEQKSVCVWEVSSSAFQTGGCPTDLVKESERPDSPHSATKELKSTGTQTADESHVLGLSVTAISAGGRETTQTGTQTEPEEIRDPEKMEGGGELEKSTESPPLSPATTPKAVDTALLSTSFFLTDPARLAERIRQRRSRVSAAFDDTEYEPYGLPEVVMKGFADIPSGPACPYVLRRGLLGTSEMPLVPSEQEEVDGQQEEDDLEP
ncbi:centromere protein F-like [Arapaima gigas]